MSEIIMNSFQKNGERHPPVYAECENCSSSEGKITGFNFGGEVIKRYCYVINNFVDSDGYCVDHDLDVSRLSDEQIWKYEKLEKSGKLGNKDKLKAQEIEDFKAL